MKKIKNILLIIIMIMLISACRSEENKTPEIPDNEHKNYSIKISGDYELTITDEDIMNLVKKDIKSTAKNPLYTAEKTYEGADIYELLKEKGVENFKNIYFKSENSIIRFTENNIKENCYVVVKEDGEVLDIPKFVKTSISDMYYINNLAEIIVLNGEVGV